MLSMAAEDAYSMWRRNRNVPIYESILHHCYSVFIMLVPHSQLKYIHMYMYQFFTNDCHTSLVKSLVEFFINKLGIKIVAINKC